MAGMFEGSLRNNDFRFPLMDRTPTRRGVSNAETAMKEEFGCPSCGSPSVLYCDAIDDDERVVCGTCGTFLATRVEFRKFVESRAVRSGVHTSRC
jgi:transcription elongation factor Elf1